MPSIVAVVAGPPRAGGDGPGQPSTLVPDTHDPSLLYVDQPAAQDFEVVVAVETHEEAPAVFVAK